MKPIIQCRDLSKRFGSKTVLQQLSFELQQGDVAAKPVDHDTLDPRPLALGEQGQGAVLAGGLDLAEHFAARVKAGKLDAAQAERLQGQVALATFANAGGLKNISGTAWVETADSGAALIGVPGVGPFGELVAGSLENSNVDLTQQLVGLMEGQRNYQANTKVLTTNKELTQVLFSAI